MIIDWEGAARGPAIADVAMTWVIIGFSDVPGPRLRAVAARGVQAAFTRSFVRAAGPIDDAWRLTAIRRAADRPERAAVGGGPPGEAGARAGAPEAGG